MANNDRQTTITPAVAAQRLGVEVYTVRRWCDWHAAHLSPTASPGAGALRRLTQSDVEVLSMVRDLRAQGLHTETINEQLEGVTFAVVDTDEQSAGDSEELATQNAPESHQNAAIVAPEYFMAIERRFEALEASRRDAISWFALGFLVAGFLFLGMVLLSWLYGGG